MSEKVILIEGGISVDDRGELLFCNDFDMTDISRFYQVSNHSSNFVRAWHAHKKESKYIHVASGAVIIAAVKVDNWEEPSKDLKIEKFILSAKKPGILFIPAGYAHGYKTLLAGTNLLFFSTTRLDESLNDDFRYDAYYWNPWEVKER
jgi:dTDP-4-dehydrorhamnose 3,5-epimerase-like enzyme